MLGLLPQTLNVGGTEYKIRSDYRSVLQIISAYNDSTLKDTEKAYVCLKRIYVDFEAIPQSAYEEAYTAAISFIECNIREDKPSPRIVNWEKDEQLIFPAINKVAGVEVRSVPYMHWWTFLGYYQAIDREDLWGFVLTIRQKKAKGKKLEKYEREFLSSNRELCQLDPTPQKAQKAEDNLTALFNALIEEGGANSG